MSAGSRKQSISSHFAPNLGDLPLSSVRVLDVTQVMAGPFCSMLLADMGADVVKIEPPGNGDQARNAMRFKLKGKDSLGFINMNRNKRSAAIWSMVTVAGLRPDCASHGGS
jgi:crotonobetainyl-CoA:carnitine CoA-transferase CaiB-like acyl-CoA transferase